MQSLPERVALYCCRNYPYAMEESCSLCDEGRNTTADDQTETKRSTFRTKFSQVTRLIFFPAPSFEKKIRLHVRQLNVLHNFDVLLTVHLNIILVINQHNAQYLVF